MPPLPTPEELEESLWRDLLDRWFPACIDPAGGYRQSFDATFRPTGDASKGLVFQSRMVWVCATAASIRPEFAEYARHGVRFLWQWPGADQGDLAFAIDAEGKPTSGETHAYGLSFALYGLAAAGRLLGDEAALSLAKNVWVRLESRFHDDAHGGYFEATDESGAAIPEGPGRDGGIGTPYGQKSQNTHLHLLEAFSELYRAWPVQNVRNRLEEVLDVLANRLFAEPGHLTLFAERDWTPASTDVSYGHDIEAAHLMLDAADALGESVLLSEKGGVLQRARALADQTLAKGWDEAEGGIFYAGNPEGPTDRSKNWWAQAEALLGFAALWRRTGDPCYGEALAREWAFIRDHQIDRTNGGWFEEAGRPERAKGHAWKAAYHDGRALLFTARLLRGGM